MSSENIEPSEYEIFLNKKTDKMYMSRSLDATQLKLSKEEGFVELSRPFRILSKMFECEDHVFIKEGKELVLRITPKARQEIVAKFYEDTRGIFSLQIQKYSSDTGNPHQVVSLLPVMKFQSCITSFVIFLYCRLKEKINSSLKTSICRTSFYLNSIF